MLERRTLDSESVLVSSTRLARQGECVAENKELYDPEACSCIVPRSSQPLRIPSPRGMLGRDSGLPHQKRNSMGTSGSVFVFFFFENYLLKTGYIRHYLELP